MSERLKYTNNERGGGWLRRREEELDDIGSPLAMIDHVRNIAWTNNIVLWTLHLRTPTNMIDYLAGRIFGNPLGHVYFNPNSLDVPFKRNVENRRKEMLTYYESHKEEERELEKRKATLNTRPNLKGLTVYEVYSGHIERKELTWDEDGGYQFKGRSNVGFNEFRLALSGKLKEIHLLRKETP